MNLHPYRWLLGGLLFGPVSLVALFVLPPMVGLGWAAMVSSGVLGWHFFPARSRRRMRALLRIRPPRVSWPSIARLIAGIFLIQWGLVAFIELIFDISSRFDPTDIPLYLAEELWNSPVRIASISLLVVVGVPALEELIFRGRLQRHFELRGSLAKAILIPATLFAVGHAGGPHWSLLLVFFSFAVFQGWLTLHTASIVPAILVHSTWNGFLLLGGLVPEWPTLGEGAIAAIGTVCAATGAWLWIWQISRDSDALGSRRVVEARSESTAQEHSHA